LKIGRIVPSITEAFSFNHIVRSLIPYFLYLSDMPSHFPETLIDLLQWAVVLCVEGKKHMYYFPLIGHILSQCPPERLTYNLYLKFFGFLENSTETSIIASLFLHIVFNCRLWCAADGSHFVRIVAHWSQSLYATAPSALTTYFSFSDLLALMRIYFWYEPIETDIIQGGPSDKRPRAANLDVEVCRQHLSRLLTAMCSQQGFLTPRDALTLIGHCFSPDSKQAISLLSLFVAVAPEFVKAGAIPESIADLMLFQFQPRSEARFALSLEALCLISRPNCSNHLHAILRLMNPSWVTPDLFQKCLNLLIRHPPIYPICAFLALHLGAPQTEMLAMALARILVDNSLAEEIVKDDFWALWPILLLLQLNSEGHDFIFGFLVSVLASPTVDTLPTLDVILDLFDLIALHTSYGVEAVSKQFLSRIAQSRFGLDNAAVTFGILSRCLKALLLYINDPTYDAITVAFAESPFGTGITPEPTPIPKIATFASIHSHCCGPTLRSGYRFGLKLNFSGQPLHRDLFAVTMSYLERFPSGNEMVTFWRRQFEEFAQHTPGNYSLIFLNQFVPLYFQTLAMTQVQRVQKCKEAIATRYSLATVEMALANGSEELRLALQDVKLILQTFQGMEAQNVRRLKRLIREDMHELSPWSSDGFRSTLPRRVFQSCREWSQPWVKSFQMTLEDIAAAPLPEIESSTFNCMLIRMNKQVSAILCIGDSDLFIVKSNGKIGIPFTNLKLVLQRQNRPNCLEFFTHTRKSYLLDFGDVSTNDVLSILKTIPSHRLQTSSAFSFFTTTDYTQQWVEGTISNFEYLMLLNIYAGRSFIDPTMYPIFPWIVKNVAHNFRDLSLPVATSSPFALAPPRPSLLAYFLGRFTPFDTLESVEAFPPFTSTNAAYQLAISGEFSSMELCPEFFFHRIV
jgi:hypothetical protein